MYINLNRYTLTIDIYSITKHLSLNQTLHRQTEIGTQNNNQSTKNNFKL